MSKKYEIRFSGSGGQGLITAGIIASKAAMFDGKKVTQTQSYGPEARGGASKSDVIISESKKINYPEATNLDYLISLTQEATDKYLFELSNKGILIVDSGYVKNISLLNAQIYEVPFTDRTFEELGTKLPTNIVALSFFSSLAKIYTKKSLVKAVSESIKPKYVKLNIKAIELGFKLAKEYNN